MTVGGGITTGEFANATFAQGMEVSMSTSILFSNHPLRIRFCGAFMEMES
jgi:hypothetical protein